MAKMVKCPGCGTAIEVPPLSVGQAGPQIVKCTNCGKGLKLVVKKPQPTGGAGQSPQGLVAGGSIAGQSVSGQSVSAMSFQDEAAPAPDLPSLDECAVCGRPTEFNRLVEDNGKLVCPDCIKGARSKIARAPGGADLIGFKAPAYAPSRRGKLINITPAFLAACVAGMIWVGCQIFLAMNPKPVGVALASPTKPKPGAAAVVDPDTASAPDEAATQPTDPVAPGPTPEAPSVEPKPPGAPVPATTPTEVALAPTEKPPLDPAERPSIFNPDGTPPSPPGAVELAPVPTVVLPVGPTITLSATDPLLKGITLLQEKEYAKAQPVLAQARTKYMLRRVKGTRLTPEQQMTLVGAAAANIALGKYTDAKSQLDIVMTDGERSRSTVLNNAITVAAGATTPGRPKSEALGIAVESLRTYLLATPGDEFACNIYGALLDEAAAMPNVTVEQLQAHWTTLDQYSDRLAGAHPGKLKWGMDWLAIEDVRRYRTSRGKITDAAAPAAPVTPHFTQTDLDVAQAKVVTMQKALETARQSGGDVIGAKTQLDAAVANAARVQAALQHAPAAPAPGGPAPKPRWPDKFDPVVPEGTITPG